MGSKGIREVLETFYDSYGWKVDPNTGQYLGQVLHEDLDPVVQKYMDKNELRYARYFREGGRYFLDAGCGAEPRRALSRGFRRHVCADISMVGLTETRKEIGEAGCYVQADLIALPFAQGAFDGTLASHCLYHIDKDLQIGALKQLYRVTSPDKSVVVFYNSNYNLISVLHKVAKEIGKISRRLVKVAGASEQKDHSEASPPALYFHGHNPYWLTRDFSKADVTCLRILTRLDTRLLRKLHLSKVILPLAAALEKAIPRALVLVGKYTAIGITVEA